MSDTFTSNSYESGRKELVQQLKSMIPVEKLDIFMQDAEKQGLEFPEPLKLHVGDSAPNFTLPGVEGQSVKLSEQLSNGPVVLVFYRGVWCPYCNLALKTYQTILPEIKKYGASLIAISPMTPDSSKETITTNELGYEVLSDAGNHTARLYTTIIKNPASSMKAMKDLGYDFHAFYDDESAELPIPSVFVIDTDSRVVFAQSLDGDYRKRTEASAILNALADINMTVEV